MGRAGIESGLLRPLRGVFRREPRAICWRGFWRATPGRRSTGTCCPAIPPRWRWRDEFGFAPLRRLVRMARPGVRDAPPFVHNDDYVFAIAGFEYG